MKEYTITLTEQEINALVNLIDLSVKAHGLNVAETAVVLVKKMSEQKKTQDQEQV